MKCFLLSMKGEVNNLTMANLDDYEMKFFSEIDIGKNEIQLFNLTFKNISMVGEYNMTGNIGDLFDIWGAGHFWYVSYKVLERFLNYLLINKSLCYVNFQGEHAQFFCIRKLKNSLHQRYFSMPILRHKN